MRRTLFALLLLAACAETRAACLARAGADLRALDADIAETEAALALGYRQTPRGAVSVGAALCTRDSPLTLCVSAERPLAARHSAIDPEAERARLRALGSHRPAVAAAAGRAAEACPSP